VIRTYCEGEYDFGIDESVVVAVTGADSEEARQLVMAHSRNDSGMLVTLNFLPVRHKMFIRSINALNLLISIVALADATKRNESVRLFAIFDLFDFSKGNSITFDELVRS
jgi:hypothetical protein